MLTNLTIDCKNKSRVLLNCQQFSKAANFEKLTIYKTRPELFTPVKFG